MGKVYSYVMDDVVDYVKMYLLVVLGFCNWVIGGYFNGGECVFFFGVKYLDVFGLIIDIFGEILFFLGLVVIMIW